MSIISHTTEETLLQWELDSAIDKYVSSTTLDNVPSDGAIKLGVGNPVVSDVTSPQGMERPTEHPLHLKEQLNNIKNPDDSLDNISEQDRKVLASVSRYLDTKGAHCKDALVILKGLLPKNCTLDTERIHENIIRARIADGMRIINTMVIVVGGPLGIHCARSQPDYFNLTPEQETYWHQTAFELVMKYGWHSFSINFITDQLELNGDFQSKLGLALIYTVCRIEYILSVTSDCLLQHAQSNYFFHKLVKEILPRQKYILKQLFCHVQEEGGSPTDAPRLAGKGMRMCSIANEHYKKISKLVRALCTLCHHIDRDFQTQ